MKAIKFLMYYKLMFLTIISISVLTLACNTSNNYFQKEQGSMSLLNPWEISLDSTYVLQNPDRYAWDLFRAVNWPADTIQMIADTARQFGDPGWVVWQTWKTGPEVYLANGHKPKGWHQKDFSLRSTKNFNQFSKKARMPDITDDPTFGLEEVVLNKATFDYVVENELYNLNGQLERYNARNEINFPIESMELKVKWRKIPDTPYEKARYHYQYIETLNDTVVSKDLYGLVAIHITSRVLKRWFWATFEHIDNRSQKHPGDDGWLLPTRDRFACKNPPYNCEQAPTNIGLEGTKWEYFLLRGSQTEYVDESGDPILLANSNVERGFQLSSSCITCHSLASIGPVKQNKQHPADSSLYFVEFLYSDKDLYVGNVRFGGKGHVGVPDSTLFKLPDSVGGKMMRNDFVWSLIEASWYQPDSTLTNN